MGRPGVGRPGMGRPSIKDVAERAGVSTALASFALNDRQGVAPATKARILAIAKELGYSADPVARALRTGSTDTYGLLVRNMRNPLFVDVIRGAQAAATAHGATVVVIDTDYSAEREREHLTRLAAQRLAGIAIAPVGTGDAVRTWRTLCPTAKTVVINAVTEPDPNVTRVAPDDASAVRQAVEHLVDLGHREITFLTAPAGVVADSDRLDAFLDDCSRLGVRSRPVEVELSLDDVERRMSELLNSPNPPTAVVTNSDYTAYAVYRAARARGVRVGAELSVVGHDDLPTSELLDPPLTTLRMDRHALGTAVFERLFRGPSMGDHVEPVELVVRGSTASPA